MVRLFEGDFSDSIGGPPSLGPGGSDPASGLGLDYPYPVRKVEVDAGQIGSGRGMEDYFFNQMEEIPGTSTLGGPFTQNVKLPFLPEMGAAKSGYYVGPGLVDKNGKIVRNQYDYTSDEEVYKYLANFPTLSERKAFLQNLYSKDFYEYGEPGSGTSNADVAAVKQFFVTANSFGRTGDVALSLINMFYPNVNASSSGSRRTVQYTANQDLASIYRQVTQARLGRAPKDEDVQRFIDAYHAVERQAQSGGEQVAMAPETLAGTQIEQKYGAEEAAVGFTNLGEVMRTLIRGQ